MSKRTFVMLMLVVGILAVAGLVLAQDEPLGILEALAIVRDTYGEDNAIQEISYDAENACWEFELADGTHGCVDEVSGEVVDSEPTTDDDASEASDDGMDDDGSEASEDDDADDDGSEASEDDDADDGSEASEDDDADDDSDEASDTGTDATPTITMEGAIAIALAIFPDSTVSNINLDTSDGTLVWDIELDDGIRSVDVSASTGDVLSFGYEADDGEHSESSDSTQTQSGQTSSDDHEGSQHPEQSEASESSSEGSE